MKKILSFIVIAGLFTTQLYAQKPTEDKSKRPSPPSVTTQKIASGATITIDYSKPAVKGRTIGKDLEPIDGKVWRTGANEATVFQTDKSVEINGKALPAGKYSFFTLFSGNQVTLIFNKTWEQWGAFKYDEKADQLRVSATAENVSSSAEQLAINMNSQGIVTLLWGNKKVSFQVK